MKRFRNILYYFLICSLFSFFFSSPTKAASERLDITVSPPVYNFNSTPGNVIKDRIRIRNNSTNTLHLKIELRKLESNGENGEAKINALEANDEIRQWITFDTPTFTSLAQEYVFVPFTIKIPPTAAFGYYIAFYISPENDTPQANENSEVTGAVAIPVLLSVKQAGAKAEAKILDFKAKSFLNEYLPVEFQTKVSNTGNIHVSPRGNIFVKGGGKDIATLEVNAGLGNILPESNRVFEASWNDGFLVRTPVVQNGNIALNDKGKQITQLQVNWNKLTSFRFGRYTASLVLVYNDGVRDIPIESTTSFWVIPYKQIAIFITALILIVLMIRYMIKSSVRKQVQKYQR